MYKILSIFVLVLNFYYVLSALDDDEVESVYSSSLMDHLDLDSILKNDRLVTSYIKCFMEEGPCTNEGKQARKIIPDIIRTQCSKCTPVQTKVVRKVMKFIADTRPKDLERFFDKYDNHRIYYDNLMSFMKADPADV